MDREQASVERERVAQAIRQLGRVFDEQVLKATYALYVPLQERVTHHGISVQRDLAYGPYPRQRLDVFGPADRATGLPVVVYFHGGGFIGGERSPVPGVVYDNVAAFFARNGCVGVNATYRVAPENPWPGGAQDVGRVVAWLKQNIGEFGGDAAKIVLMGQSAGASHVASWVLDANIHGAGGSGAAAAILLSGVYAPKVAKDAAPELPPHRAAYFGTDPMRWPAMRLADQVRKGHPPLFVGMAEFDPHAFSANALELVAALLEADGHLPWIRLARDHNHVSPALQIGCAIDDLGPELLEFTRKVTESEDSC